MSPRSQSLVVRCACGRVEYEAMGKPIVSVTCYCKSCQTAGRQFEQLPSAAKVLDTDGGTPYIAYRKDRVTCLKGSELLEDRRLTSKSPTRRVLASCCNSAMLLDFTKGHWLSIYRARFQNDMHLTEVRVMTGDKPEGVVLPEDVPNYKGHSGKLMWRLLVARAAMLVGH